MHTLKAIATLAIVIATVAFAFLAFADALTGCGQPIYHADGTWRVEAQSCFLSTPTPATGRWR